MAAYAGHTIFAAFLKDNNLGEWIINDERFFIAMYADRGVVQKIRVISGKAAYQGEIVEEGCFKNYEEFIEHIRRFGIDESWDWFFMSIAADLIQAAHIN